MYSEHVCRIKIKLHQNPTFLVPRGHCCSNSSSSIRARLVLGLDEDVKTRVAGAESTEVVSFHVLLWVDVLRPTDYKFQRLSESGISSSRSTRKAANVNTSAMLIFNI
jgi:hypothetical protein